jgi:hypothetical protein
MGKHISFKDWEAKRATEQSESTEVDGDGKAVSKEKSNAEILAEITSLREKKGLAAKNKSSYDHQLHELDIKLLELELERNRLVSKKKEISEAAEIAKSKQVKDGRQQEEKED